MPELPRGVVTFLFTDIEASTRLWETDRDAMRAGVARHLALLDAAIAAARGIHFETVGDAVQAAFETASQAVAAALTAQQALLAKALGCIAESNRESPEPCWLVLPARQQERHARRVRSLRRLRRDR